MGFTTVFRVSSAVIASLVAACVVAMGVVVGGIWFFHGRHVDNLSVGAFATVGPRPDGWEILGAGEACPGNWPVKVGLRNEASKTLLRARISVKATVPGHSTDLLDGHGVITDDTILKPGEAWERCYDLGAGSATVYVASIADASFE